MSVINKVLRDLDQRLATNRNHPVNPLDTRSIAAKQKKNPPLWLTLVVGGITLVIVGWAVWWSIQPAPIAIPVPRPPPPSVAVAIPPPPPSTPPQSAPAPASAPSYASITIASSALPKLLPAASTVKAIPSLPKPASAKTVASAPFAHSPSVATPHQSAVSAESAPSLRETVRLQLARGDYTGIWNTLSHLEESPKHNNSDLWAIRANAAQRLGKHQDSVHAYLMALEANPNESRWLLGAAVSLAALGKTTQASEMAEKARSLAPINKDVLNYLRQSGVSLND